MTTTTILIIDDNLSQQAKLEEILKPLPNPVLRTDTMEKALDIMRYSEVSVILLGYKLKGLNIIDFMNRLQSDYSKEDTHVIIVLDENKKKEDSADIYKVGAVDYIEKPFGPVTIRSMVKVFDRLYFKKKRVKELLLNILPREIAVELEEKGKVKPKRYGLASVMFADFVSFTHRTKEMSPVELLNHLDTYFAGFDKVITKYHIEKIKTIGDAYMSVAGIPEKRKENPVHAALAALEISYQMEKMQIHYKKYAKFPWTLRIGIHSGPLVAGVIGKKKFAYDVWGDTVNIASRICSACEPGKVNISQATYDKIKDYFNCEYRGEVEGKNIGHIGMYYVNSIKPEFSQAGKGKFPNTDLKQIAGLVFIQYERFKEHILNRLKKELPENLSYHGVHHTLDVLHTVINLGKNESLSENDQLILNTAALLHDCGYIYTYHHNEELAVKMAKKILPDFGYSTLQIKTICSIIRTTKIKSVPKTKLQKIMNDADYDYLGRKDYTQIADSLLKELLLQGYDYTELDWLKIQIKFLERHKFYTQSSKTLRDESKAKLLADLKIKMVKLINGK